MSGNAPYVQFHDEVEHLSHRPSLNSHNATQRSDWTPATRQSKEYLQQATFLNEARTFQEPLVASGAQYLPSAQDSFPTLNPQAYGAPPDQVCLRAVPTVVEG